jgi:hypothetical protein
MTNDEKVTLGFVAFFVVVGILLLCLGLHKTEFTATVDGRWWHWYRAYRYETCHDDWVCEDSCRTDDSGMEHCTESCSWEEDCTTWTRCDNKTSGDTLPPIQPSLSCSPDYGDWEVNNTSYHFRYHAEDGKQITASFQPHDWDIVEPGGVITGVKNGFGTVLAMEKVK